MFSSLRAHDHPGAVFLSVTGEGGLSVVSLPAFEVPQQYTGGCVIYMLNQNTGQLLNVLYVRMYTHTQTHTYTHIHTHHTRKHAYRYTDQYTKCNYPVHNLLTCKLI